MTEDPAVTLARHDERIIDAERRLAAINGNIARTGKALEDLRVALARFAVGATAFTVLSNALVALIVYVLTT